MTKVLDAVASETADQLSAFAPDLTVLQVPAAQFAKDESVKVLEQRIAELEEKVSFLLERETL